VEVTRGFTYYVSNPPRQVLRFMGQAREAYYLVLDHTYDNYSGVGMTAHTEKVQQERPCSLHNNLVCM
jgi:hypothetical protein